MTRSRCADRSDFALLQHPQQLRLQYRRHFADFVEKYDSPVGRAKNAQRTSRRAGKCALFMPEELALGQRLGQGRAIDGYKRLVRAGTKLVQYAGPDFLARAGLAGNENGAFDGGRAFDVTSDTANRGVSPQHPIRLAGRLRRQQRFDGGNGA